jgi:hypothetical protein
MVKVLSSTTFRPESEVAFGLPFAGATAS